jgi:hypothetical protein
MRLLFFRYPGRSAIAAAISGNIPPSRQGGDVMAIVQRVQSICLKPKEEWPIIAAESGSTQNLYKSYALPLAAIGAVAGFIGNSFVGYAPPLLPTIRVSLVNGLVGAVLKMVLSLLGTYVLALIIDAFAPKYGGQKNAAQAVKLAVYSFTPGWIAGILFIYPSPALGVLALIAMCYGIYLLYLGLPQLMKSPPDKAMTYTLVVVACGIGVAIVTELVTRPFSVASIG